MRHPDRKDYVATIEEELRGYQAAVLVWDELKAKNKSLSDERLDYISSAHSAVCLTQFVIDEYKNDFAEDYKQWLSLNVEEMGRYRSWKAGRAAGAPDARLDRYVSIVLDSSESPKGQKGTVS
jgi:hypothetical protein